MTRAFLFLMSIAFPVLTLGQSRGVAPASSKIASLRFINEYIIPNDAALDGTTIGGLSGIDFDAKNNLYYLISDDRGAHGPTRFYTANIAIDQRGITDVTFRKVVYLLDAKKQRYATKEHNPDAEGIRIDPSRGLVYWTSEGERSVNGKTQHLVDPAIRVSDLSGTLRKTISLPSNLRMTSAEKGPRQNSALEGVALEHKTGELYLAIEEPLYEDGPRADTIPNGATCRIYRFDASGKHIGQYAYELEPVAFPPKPATKFRINGISEILSTETPGELIVVERSFSMGRLPSTVRVFLTNVNEADNIITKTAIEKTVVKAQKRLLINMDALGIHIDNIEGVTFGPTLPNGNRTLIFLSDNNFNWFQSTQLLLFEVISGL